MNGPNSKIDTPFLPLSKRKVTLFIWALLLITGLMVSLGWFTNIREAAHQCLLWVFVFAFFPFLVIALGLLIFLFTFVLALAGDSDGIGGLDHVGDGLEILKPYYRFLGKQKHPVFWGIPAGILSGGLCLLALVYPLIVAKEAETADRMMELQSALQAYQEEHGTYPRPDEEGRLDLAALGLAGAKPYAEDRFGQSIFYVVDDRLETTSQKLKDKESKLSTWAGKVADKAMETYPSLEEKVKQAKKKYAFASFSLTSLGYDGKESNDDLYLEGHTALSQKLETWKQESTLFTVGALSYEASKILSMRKQASEP